MNNQTEVKKQDVVVVVDQVKAAKDFISSCGTTSAAIRRLTTQGKTRSEIVAYFELSGHKIRYQHVRNVQITPIKKELVRK